jgi:hypothetical protein
MTGDASALTIEAMLRNLTTAQRQVPSLSPSPRLQR